MEMNPAYIYFKELDIHKDDNFTLNFSRDKEIENVIFDKDCEYAVTGLKINVKLPEGQVIKIEDKKKLDQKSKEIKEIIKNYKEPNLTLYISNPETTLIEIPFKKKSETELPLKKYTYFNSTSKRKEDFFVYDYINHLKKYGFNWKNSAIGLRYFIKIIGTNKIQRKLTMKACVRKMIVVDEQRIFNLHYSVRKDLSDASKKYFTILMAYLWNPRKDFANVFDFTALTKKQKKQFIRDFSSSHHYNINPKIDSNFFTSYYYHSMVSLWLKNESEYIL